MNPKKQSRRKNTASKLEPIDWREFANDAVLNGNMSTLYRRPPSEDPSAYASPEAMIEIEKRVIRDAPDAPPVEALSPVPHELSVPTVGINPPAGEIPAVGSAPIDPSLPAAPLIPTVGTEHTVGSIPTPSRKRPINRSQPTAPTLPTVGIVPTGGTKPSDTVALAEGLIPTVGTRKKVKPIRTVHDALTLAGQVLYRAMLGTHETSNVSCTKGYRQLAAETHLDKDTVRDLIVEFKHKGILHETATYDPDTRLSKTYQVLSHQAVLQAWRDAGIHFVTAGRQRPLFCSATGNLIDFIPTVGLTPTP